MSSPAFVPGLQLAGRLYADVVAPLLGERPHSAALLGSGSEVLGFDTERSTDHGWGPRLQVFVPEPDVEGSRALIDGGLPETFEGWPISYGWDDVPVSHHVEVAARPEWFRRRLGFDPADGVSTVDWLSTPSQLLLEVTAGTVFRDEGGELAVCRAALAWYPRDVWLWLLACQWRRIAQEEAFVGRTAEAGDDLGSRVLAARLCRDVMRLCFLLERRYAPYSKWLGTAFARLDAAAELGPALARALAAGDHPEREAGLCDAYEALARRQNSLGLVEALEPTVRQFHGRPYRVLAADRFVEACLGPIESDWLRLRPLVGAVDQFADSTDVLSSPLVARRLGAAYEPDS